MKEKPLRPCVRVIVIKDSKLLIGWKNVRGNKLPVFPGGGIEEGNSIEEAAQQEVLEEAGVSVTDVSAIGLVAEYPGMSLGRERDKLFSGAKDTYVMAKFHRVDKSLHNSEGDAFSYTWETPAAAHRIIKNSPPSEKNEARLQAVVKVTEILNAQNNQKQTLKKW